MANIKQYRIAINLSKHTKGSTFLYSGLGRPDVSSVEEVDGRLRLVFCFEADEGEAAELALGRVLELDIGDVALGAERLSQRLLRHLEITIHSEWYVQE